MKETIGIDEIMNIFARRTDYLAAAQRQCIIEEF